MADLAKSLGEWTGDVTWWQALLFVVFIFLFVLIARVRRLELGWLKIETWPPGRPGMLARAWKTIRAKREDRARMEQRGERLGRILDDVKSLNTLGDAKAAMEQGRRRLIHEIKRVAEEEAGWEPAPDQPFNVRGTVRDEAAFDALDALYRDDCLTDSQYALLRDVVGSTYPLDGMPQNRGQVNIIETGARRCGGEADLRLSACICG